MVASVLFGIAEIELEYRVPAGAASRRHPGREEARCLWQEGRYHQSNTSQNPGAT
jgi:hypothetical protein